MRLLNVGIAVLSISIANAATPLAPSNDSFYSPPSGYENEPVGTILKSRPVPEPLEGLNYSHAYQLLYRTSTASGDPEADVTTVIVPNNTPKDVLLSYQIPEDASWVNCAPSYSLMTSNGSAELQEVLDNGWYLNIPDYEGPLSSFTAGIHAGYSTLDSIKAALSSGNDTGIPTDARVGLWGYSGGSLASGWAAQLQPSYAPDLTIDATAVGGFLINITAISLGVNGGLYSGFLPAGILGLASQYPAIKAVLNDYLLPNVSAEFYKANDTCLVQDLVNYIDQDVFSYFKDGENLLELPQVQQVLTENTLALNGSKPGSPLFIYQGILDQIAPVGEVDKAVDRYCAAGATIQYNKDPYTDHTGTDAAGSDDALEWLKKVLQNNSKPASGCVTITTAFGNDTVAAVTVPYSGNVNVTATATSSSTAESAVGSASSTGSSGSGNSNLTTPTTSTTGSSPETGAATSLPTNSILAFSLFLVGLAIQIL